MALNAFWSRKKVLVVGIGDNAVAQRVAAALKSAGMEEAAYLPALGTYAGYYAIAEEQPDYTLIISECAASACKVQPCKVEDCTGGKKRDTSASSRAKGYFRHRLKLLGLEPRLMGAHKIPFDEVKYEETAWYWQDKTPLLWACLPAREGVPEAAVEAVKDYFAKGRR